MNTYTTVTVPANSDLDNCLTGAADAYIAQHPELAGWDLEPRWADETRESVTLTVPEVVATGITDRRIRALSTEAGEHGDLEMVAICERALAGDEQARRECTRVIADAAQAD